MHILVTVNAAWNIVNFRRALIEHLIQSGHSVTVLAPPDDSVEQIRALGCRFLPLGMSAEGMNPMGGLKMIMVFRKLFRREKPDIVLSYTIKNNIFGAIAARHCGVPFVPNVTGLGTAFLSGSLLEKVAERLYRHAFSALPTVFFQNRDDRELFVQRGLIRKSQAELLPGSGIDLQRFTAAPYPADTDAPVFLMIARLLRDKGAMEYVEAARLLRQSHPGARFQMLGPVGAENRTAIGQDTVDGWVNEGIIEYLGTTSDVRPFIAAAHCVVLPSYREGAPRTLIEAAAMARPLIATDVPGCREVVEAGQTGLLCDVRSGSSLARVCKLFLDMPHAEQAAMGQAGRAKMTAEYDQSLVISAYCEVIKRVSHAADFS
ncbi:glycosyltransferase family 4 protein [Ruegeria atlantica]|uniref:glycosyltransferase family 4 protein n=1 Tax=Ruegeria atlantica TaxID=81569 RepID=UPI002493E79B|nr:glycosyltransferase family 4 protein [Ruegeria atlantica]